MKANDNWQNSNLKLNYDKEKDIEIVYLHQEKDKENSFIKNKKFLYFLILFLALFIIIIIEALTRTEVFNWSLSFEKNLQKNKSDFIVNFFKIISDIGNAKFYIPVKFFFIKIFFH
jgi:hypothetical protein